MRTSALLETSIITLRVFRKTWFVRRGKTRFVLYWPNGCWLFFFCHWSLFGQEFQLSGGVLICSLIVAEYKVSIIFIIKVYYLSKFVLCTPICRRVIGSTFRVLMNGQTAILLGFECIYPWIQCWPFGNLLLFRLHFTTQTIIF